MHETTGTDSAPSESPITPPPDEGNYEDVSGGETSPQSGAPEAAEGDGKDSDTGGRAHTSSTEGHPAGTGERSAREVGGPVAAEDAEETTGGAKGDIQTKGFDAHE